MGAFLFFKLDRYVLVVKLIEIAVMDNNGNSRALGSEIIAAIELAPETNVVKLPTAVFIPCSLRASLYDSNLSSMKNINNLTENVK